jgi:hypothetical protein
MEAKNAGSVAVQNCVSGCMIESLPTCELSLWIEENKLADGQN